MTPEQIAEKINKLGMQVPASFIIDSHVPVFNLLHTVFHCFSPLISPLVSSSTANKFFEILKNENDRELILDLISGEGSK